MDISVIAIEQETGKIYTFFFVLVPGLMLLFFAFKCIVEQPPL
jgi:hypothetical protein